MAKIHIILQGKGGVGKSFVAALMAQYLRDRGQEPICYDTDPVNPTFSGYEAFKVRRVQLVEQRVVNPRRFDALMEGVLELEPETHVIIDNGAASFVPLCEYLLSCQVPELLEGHGHELVLHSVVTGGQSQDDTLEGLLMLLEAFPDCACVVWLNPFLGAIERNGKTFQELRVYKRFEDRVRAVVTLPDFNKATFGKDIEELLKARKPFCDARAVPGLGTSVMSLQRLKLAGRELFASVAEAGVL